MTTKTRFRHSQLAEDTTQGQVSLKWMASSTKSSAAGLIRTHFDDRGNPSFYEVDYKEVTREAAKEEESATLRSEHPKNPLNSWSYLQGR